MSDLSHLSIAERHRTISAGFTRLVEATADWDAPTPVAEWCARDIVSHFVTWLPALFESAPGMFPTRTLFNPVHSWEAHQEAVQNLLDDPEQSQVTISSPMFGELAAAEAVDRFYTPDVFMHTWDLARATGQDDTVDAAFATELLDGMSQMEEALRSSGHYGERQPVADDARAQEKLMAFVGRDPQWGR